MAIDSSRARQLFVEKMEKKIDEELISHGGSTIKVFLGSTSNFSEGAMGEIKMDYEKQDWEVSFKKKRFPDIFSIFSKDRDLYIILTR